jgi:hypothetical protein
MEKLGLRTKALIINRLEVRMRLGDCTHPMGGKEFGIVGGKGICLGKKGWEWERHKDAHLEGGNGRGKVAQRKLPRDK